jgi:radical SAM protein with 4Fe4S-binding SPASM domain
MISVTKLLGGGSNFEEHPGSGPVVVWNATKTCNRRFPDELTTSEALAMIGDLAKMQVPELVVSGGEPLARPDILDLADYATTLGVPVTFSTNGTLIDERKARRMADIGVTYVGISIDGAFRDAVRGIRHCRDAGLRVGLRFTVTQDNVNEIGSIFRIVENEGIGSLWAGIDLEPAQTRALMNQLLDQVERWNGEGREVEVMTIDNDADAPFIYYWLLDRDPRRAGDALSLMRHSCGNRSGIAIAAIDSFGVVHPDEFTSTHSLGSIRERPFSAIWRDSRIQLLERLRDRQPLLKGRCATCQWLSVCNGNFRARAEAATGDYWQSDPGCYLLDSEVISGVPE